MSTPGEMMGNPSTLMQAQQQLPHGQQSIFPPSTQNIEIQMDKSVAVPPKASCNSPNLNETLPAVTPKTADTLSQSVVGEPSPPETNLDSYVSNIASPSHNNMTSNDENVENAAPRRSGRERTSTLIYVDGHAIKKDNNYVMKGLTYEYGVVTGQEQPRTARQGAPKASSALKPKQLRAPPTLSQAEINRRQLKQEIAHRIEQKQAQRQLFFKQNVKVLKPFLEPKVLQKIMAFDNWNRMDTEQTYEQPKGIKAEMRDYQLKGLNWMSNMYSKNLGFILGDEMGLGKTLQTISLVCHLREQFGVKSGPTLIVVPLSVLYSWCNEIKKWSNLTFFRLHLSNTEKVDVPDLGAHDMVVTTYEMTKAPALKSVWSRQHFNLVVLDEGHRIKGIDTLQSQAGRKIHCENRIILTGTPLANNLSEMYALLSFLLPDLFTTVEPFANACDLTNNFVDKDMLDKANKVLSLFMIRRLKSLVEKKMPKKIETKVICPLSNTQIWWYKALLLKDLRLLTGEGSGSGKTGALNNLIMQLRKCVNHPYLFPFAEDLQDEATVEELIGESGKLAVLDLLLQSLYKKGHRVCLFSQFTSMLDILDDYARLRGWNYCRFDGGTSRAERNFVINSFNEPGSKKFLFLISTRAGGMGLNLQTADTVVLFDSDWNPQADVQAEARVHRIGQTKTVFVYRMITANTVEERIAERAAKKMFMAAKIMKDGSADATKEAEESEDSGQMMEALKFGCNAVFGNGAQQKMELPTPEDIEMLTDRSRTEAFTGGNIKGGNATNTEQFDAMKEYTSTTNFGGIDFKKLRSDYQKKRNPKDMGAICDVWKKKKRERKSRITLVASNGSGYGAPVPVLKANDYDLESGERSVFQQELGGRKGNFKNVGSNHLKAGVDFENQGECQVCGDGGRLLCCPRCPVSVHPECAQCTEKTFMCCTHHNCYKCGKSPSDAGGFMFRCSCCPRAFCEDHLPKEARQLERCERMEKLGYKIKNGIYVHCSPVCENVAVQEYGYVLLDKQKKDPCPDPIDVSKHFGGEVDDCLDTPEDLILNTKRRRKQATKYGDYETPQKPSATAGVVSLPNSLAASSSGSSSIASSNSAGSSHSVASSDDSVVVAEPVKAKPKTMHNTKPPAVLKKPSLVLNPEKGEYVAFVPVVNGSLNLEIGTIGKNNHVCFMRYKKFQDGSKSLVELRGVMRGTGDRIIGINGKCCRQSSFEEVMRTVQIAKEFGRKLFSFEMQEYAAWKAEVAAP